MSASSRARTARATGQGQAVPRTGRAQQWKEEQAHHQPSEHAGSEPLGGAAVAWKISVKQGKGKPRRSRAVDVRNQPRNRRMNVVAGPLTERRLEALIGLERLQYAQFGLGEHQQGMRGASA